MSLAVLVLVGLLPDAGSDLVGDLKEVHGTLVASRGGVTDHVSALILSRLASLLCPGISNLAAVRVVSDSTLANLLILGPVVADIFACGGACC